MFGVVIASYVSYLSGFPKGSCFVRSNEFLASDGRSIRSMAVEVLHLDGNVVLGGSLHSPAPRPPSSWKNVNKLVYFGSKRRYWLLAIR